VVGMGRLGWGSRGLGDEVFIRCADLITRVRGRDWTSVEFLETLCLQPSLWSPCRLEITLIYDRKHKSGNIGSLEARTINSLR
jgi:hypothetical protein